MGWLINTQLSLLQNFINEKLKMFGANEVYIAGDVRTKMKTNLSRSRWDHEYIEVWFVAHSERQGTDFIGLMLVDFDPDVKEHADLTGVVYDIVNEKSYSMTDDLVQAWGYKDMDCCMGQAAESVPLHFLDLVPEHESESCRNWRRR